MRGVAIVLTVFICACSPRAALAQSTGGPFSTIEVVAGGAVTAAAAPLASYWKTGPGLGVRIDTPFYLGNVFGLVQTAQVTPLAGVDVPAYRSVHAAAGWGAPVALPLGVRVMPALRIGTYHMRFDDPQVSAAVANETELTAGVDVRVRVPLGGGWAGSGSVAVLRVFTNQPIDMRIVEVGISRRLATPNWLRRALE